MELTLLSQAHRMHRRCKTPAFMRQQFRTASQQTGMIPKINRSAE
jgi:hypothetical protein